MPKQLTYNEILTFYKVAASGYRGTKTIVDSAEVMCIYVQNTGFQKDAFQENSNSDAVVYPDFNNEFIVENANRLEGMYVLAEVYGGDPDIAWYKIESVDVNRDHLLGNQIDNIECRLKKTEALSFVS